MDGNNLHVLTIYEPAVYRIRVLGSLDEAWWDYLGELSAETEPYAGRHKMTTLTGRLADQGALVGLLDTLFNFGLPILSVEYLVE
jgi:hypothetical protein